MNPDKYTIKELFLDVGDGHELYIQEWGNPKAKTPIIFLHGGPGGGVQNKYRGQFIPTQHRVIFFDQRGSGQSIPKGSLEHNTTQDLVEDIEKFAKRLKLRAFVLIGGSWGSCLALAYALKYPKRVEAMVLNGIWTGSKEETDFVEKGKFRPLFPDVWEEYVETTPKQYHDDPSSYHIPRILGNDVSAIKKSGYTFSNLEGSLLSLDDRYIPEDFETFDPASIRMEIHYVAHNVFLPDRYIMSNAHKLKMPIWLVQGRYDVVCPPAAAYELHKKLPNSQLIWTTNGHRADHESWNVQRTILRKWT